MTVIIMCITYVYMCECMDVHVYYIKCMCVIYTCVLMCVVFNFSPGVLLCAFLVVETTLPTRSRLQHH